MKKRLLVKLFSVGLLSLSLVSCKKDDEKLNQITDAAGVNVTLTWSLTDGTSATTGADLDLYLYKGADLTNEVDFSDNTSSFEDVDLVAADTDGEYTVAVDHYSISAGKQGSFTVKVQGKGTTTNYEFANNTFAASDAGEENQIVRIKKEGNTYTVTKL